MTGAGARTAAPGWSVRTHVVLTVLVALLPVLLLAAFLARAYVAAESERFERGVRDAVFDTALALERDLAGTTAALEALATSPALVAGDIAAFHAQAREIQALLGGPIFLRDVTGRQIVSTLVPWGTPLPQGSSLTRWDPEILASDRPLVTGHYVGILDHTHNYAVAVPVHRDGAIAYILHVSPPATRLRDILRAGRLPGAGSVGLTDRDGIILARRERHEEFVGRPGNALARLRAMRAEEETARQPARDGWDSFTVYRRLPTSGWVLAASVPVEAVLGPLYRTLWTAAGIGAALLALALLGAAVLGHRLARSIRGLADLAAGMERDAPVAPPRGPVREVNEVGVVLANAAARHGMMVHELNHRVRNTLATVDSLARLSARHAASVAEHEASLSERIRSLGKTHVLLSGVGWTEAGLEEVLRNELAVHDSGGGRVILDGPPVPLPTRHAVAMGMLVHELATNAAKHGALSRPEGRLEVRWVLRQAEGGTRLDLTWTERGGPPVAPPSRQGFGTTLIQRGLARDLSAEMRGEYAPEGLRFHLSMPVAGSPGAASSAARSDGVRAAIPQAAS